MVSSVEISLSSTGLDQLLSSSYGPVSNHLRNLAHRVETVAKRNCPVYSGAPRRDGVRPGALRDSIKVTQRKAPGGGLEFSVGSDLHYAKFVHDGTNGPITPKTAPFMVFVGPQTGLTVFATQVRGQHGNPFLRDALREVIGT